jgi:hypothetical protein
MTPIRLAVLVCGTPIPAIKEEYGDYHAMVRKLLQDSCPAQSPGPEGPVFVLDRFDVVHAQEYPQGDADYAGIFMTGSCMFRKSATDSNILTWSWCLSAASAYDDAPWIKNLIAYITELVESKSHVKLIGQSMSLSHVLSPSDRSSFSFQGSVLASRSLPAHWVLLVFSTTANGKWGYQK